MAPGGRVLSESEIRDVYPLVGDAGEEYVEPIPPECISLSRYTHIYTPDPSSVFYSGGFIMPRAVGMPITESSDDNLRQGGFINTANLGNAVSLGPALGGSSHSYQHNGTYDDTGLFLLLYGGRSNPKWSNVTYIRASGWGNHVMNNEGGTGGGYVDFGIFAYYSGNQNDYFMPRLMCRDYSPVRWEASFSSGFAQYTFMPVPAFAGINPLIDNQPVYYSLDINTAAQTITFTVNSTSWSYTGPQVWPAPSYWANRLSNYSAAMSMYTYISYHARHRIPGPATGWFSDLTLDTDVPWCNY
jgi:hypothetical protein